MKYVAINDSDKLSRFCFGCEPLGGQDWGKVRVTDIKRAIELSLDLGVNFFDTADVYGLGLSEERLSKILGNRRFDVFIATKGGVAWSQKKGTRARTFLDSSPAYITKAVDNSLKRLRLNSIPIYYIHWPDPKTDIRSTFESLSRLQSNGKILYLGCSNFSAQQLLEASKFVAINFVQIPVNTLIGYPSLEFIKTCNKLNISIVAYNALASGMLTGKYTSNSKFPKNDRRSGLPSYQGSNFKESLIKIEMLRIEAQRENLTLSQYSLNWVLKNKNIDFVIVGIKNMRQVEENVLSTH